jgi:hypothetical protein
MGGTNCCCRFARLIAYDGGTDLAIGIAMLILGVANLIMAFLPNWRWTWGLLG